ncbi:MAG: hypothetical protein GWP16_01665 [Nitrospirae bacterium]|nr:hypothetical protein [Nitrospirota bacterium]
MSRLRNSYLGQAWLILLMAGVFGALLAAVASDRREHPGRDHERDSRPLAGQ